ncbi:trypsin-like peptidase domain-containing protein [Desertivirga arenae]|uniref:trypsin-like peptidase domain-containing protein n=1 Tax=Desertivirga arenae TaxID=2810309 RepID=UPI001F611743|nr:trypsin-like peptidase domain-containing protein [Pedobacter sp. SYSU D00823]
MASNNRQTLVKYAGLMLATGLVSAIMAISGYRYFDNQQLTSIAPASNYKISYANFPENAQIPAAPDFVQAAAAASPAVVHIKTTYTSNQSSRSFYDELFGGGGQSNSPARASGSGVLISADGYIVTNNHVVENASQIEVSLPDRRSFTAKLIGRDPNTDLALLKVNGSNLPIVELGNSDQVQVGEWVLAVGYPLSLNSTVTAGIISAKGRSIGILDQAEPGQGQRQGEQAGSTAVESFLQTDAAINPGNSGGALVNSSGQLIGINAAIASQTGSYAGYGFAIPINLAKKIISDLRSYGEVRRGYLGVSFPAPSAEEQLLKQQGINPGSVQGVYITGVQQGSAAASAGLREGDVIQSIDGTRVASSAEFSERIARHRPGDKVQLSYLRNGRTANTSVTLKGEQTASAPQSSSSVLQGKLGATFGALPSNVKQYYGLSRGVLVTGIERGGYFERAGIPKNTVIFRVNGQSVTSDADINAALAASRNGMVRIEGITPDGMRFVVNFPTGA